MHLFHVCSYTEVLVHFRDDFLATVDANVIIHQLREFGIVSRSEMVTIERCRDADQNHILLDILQQKLDVNSLKTLCDVMIHRSSSKMQSLAYQMKAMLDCKSCMLMCSVHT